jgi:ribonuclease D
VIVPLIEDGAALDAVIDEVAQVERYALDTEFHRERTYYPKLALVQLAWPGGLVLVDPLAVDPHRLVPLFKSDAVAVVHAAQQDLDVLTHACGAVPERLFDTQLAAGFVGQSTPSLVNLVQTELGVSLPKGDRLTDWLRRPLTSDQRAYAASDVEHLLELHDVLVAKLNARGRLGWVLDACEELRTRPTGPTLPEDAWLRLKDVRTLKPRARGVARAVAEWRERRAMSADIPVRQVLPDLAILGISQRAPRTVNDLAQARGVDDRHVRGNFGNEILAAVERGLTEEVDLPRADHDDLERRLRPAVALVSAWMSELARTEHLDTSLLATRSDLVALLRGDPDARLRNGWRAEVVGEDITRLVEGRAALTFDDQRGLRLIGIEDQSAVRRQDDGGGSALE